jgi:CTP-dependent riboflavin kinase
VTSRSFTGTVTGGLGKATSVLDDEGVLDDLHERIGVRVVPGTLNLRLPARLDRRLLPVYIAANEIDADWETRTGQAGYFLAPVLVAERYRGAVFQANESGYPDDLVELMAETHLRTALDLDDGDPVTFAILDG